MDVRKCPAIRRTKGQDGVNHLTMNKKDFQIKIVPERVYEYPSIRRSFSRAAEIET